MVKGVSLFYSYRIGKSVSVATYEGKALFRCVPYRDTLFLILGDKMLGDKTINQRVKELRTSRNVSQETLGMFLGIKTSTYSQMERAGIISAERLKLIAEFFNVDYEFLLYGVTPEPEPKKEIDINLICEVIRREFKMYYEERYNFLHSFSDVELKHIKMISYLSKSKRRAVYEYAYKLFKKEIKVD